MQDKLEEIAQGKRTRLRLGNVKFETISSIIHIIQRQDNNLHALE